MYNKFFMGGRFPGVGRGAGAVFVGGQFSGRQISWGGGGGSFLRGQFSGGSFPGGSFPGGGGGGSFPDTGMVENTLSTIDTSQIGLN